MCVLLRTTYPGSTRCSSTLTLSPLHPVHSTCGWTKLIDLTCQGGALLQPDTAVKPRRWLLTTGGAESPSRLSSNTPPLVKEPSEATPPESCTGITPTQSGTLAAQRHTGSLLSSLHPLGGHLDSRCVTSSLCVCSIISFSSVPPYMFITNPSLLSLTFIKCFCLTDNNHYYYCHYYHIQLLMALCLCCYSERT